MKRLIRLAVPVAAAGGVLFTLVSARTGPVLAGTNDTSHLRITSTVPNGGSSLDPVINNNIDVVITVKDTGFPNTQDSGTLNLRPGATPAYTWTCTSCGNGYFSSVTACYTNGGCAGSDVQSWVVGVIEATNFPDEVQYDISSANLGNGFRYASGPSCSSSVSPVTATYSATDYKAAWDSATPCTNSGVAINLDYQ